MKTKPLDELKTRAHQHFVDSIATKQLGAQSLPLEVARAVLLITRSIEVAMADLQRMRNILQPN
jgi:hypothetical protein